MISVLKKDIFSYPIALIEIKGVTMQLRKKMSRLV